MSVEFHTEETKKKISESLKGRTGGFQGKHHSEESKKKISEGNVGKQPTTGMSGRTHSEATKRKMSLRALARPPVSEETRQKLSEKRRGRSYKRPPHSEETKEKLSRATIQQRLDGQAFTYGVRSCTHGVRCDSSYETARVVQLVELGAQIERYRGSIQYSHPDGTVHRYLPDFLVTLDGQSWVEEVKAAWALEDPVVQAKFKAAKLVLSDFRVITEDEIFGGQHRG